MADTHEIATVEAVLDDPVFAGLAEEAVRDYIAWDELTKRPLPAGMSADDAWRVLTTIRRYGATRFPIKDMHGRLYWYTMTREGDVSVDAIERYCHTDSVAHRAILHRHGRVFLVGSRVREAIAVCQLDGVVVNQAKCERMLMSGRAAQDDTEQLVLNSHALLYELDDMDDVPFSPDLLRGLYDRLVEGVDVSKLERVEYRHGLADLTETEPVGSKRLEEVFREFCAYANGQTGDPSEAVAMKGHALISTMHYWHFLPDFNGIIGRCVFRLYATRQDYPVLSYLPISSWYRAWLQGQTGTSIVRFTKLDRGKTENEDEVDYTPDVITYLQLTVAALDELLRSIERARHRDSDLRATLEQDVELNYRQRSILSRALVKPETEFRIREHQTTHNVVYATARADLLDLVERGYMRQESRGRAFVFVAQPSLAKRLSGKR